MMSTVVHAVRGQILLRLVVKMVISLLTIENQMHSFLPWLSMHKLAAVLICFWLDVLVGC